MKLVKIRILKLKLNLTKNNNYKLFVLYLN